MVAPQTTPGSCHLSVLGDEVCEFLRAKSDEPQLIFDGTLGGAGHLRRLLDENENFFAVACDRDQAALGRTAETLSSYGARVQVFCARYSEVSRLLEQAGPAFVDSGLKQPLRFARVLVDLGLSSDQLNDPARGFSFRGEAALDMRMNRSGGPTAADLLNQLDAAALRALFRRGGLRAQVRELVEEILRSRPLITVADFRLVCERVFLSGKARRARGEKSAHPATVPFQALRIAVNDEFGEIERLLAALPELVTGGARLAFISFHSLEDELVTKALRRWARPRETNPITGERAAHGSLLTPKAVVPADAELEANPRARSARLRVFEFAPGFTGGLAWQ